MSVEQVSRSNCIQIIGNAEVESIVRASIEHFVLPIIAGMSMDELTQKEYEAMGGTGKKPEPYSQSLKLSMYTKMKEFIRPKILAKVTELVNAALVKSFAAVSDEDLRAKVKALKEKVIVPEPNWSKLKDLFKDHLFLFKEVDSSSNLKGHIIAVHDVICPIMAKYRDSGELFKILM